MSKVTNQIEKVNSEEELQAMAKKLSRTAESVFQPSEAIEFYKVLKEMQVHFDYDQTYADDYFIQNLVIKMEAMREYFLEADQYFEASRKQTNGWVKINVEFNHFRRF